MSSIARRITQWTNDEVGVVLKASYRLYRGNPCDIRVAKTNRDIAKLLLIVSRKTGNAPDRNRFKRRMKSIFYQEKLYTKGFDWVIFAKKDGLKTDYQELKALMLEASTHL